MAEPKLRIIEHEDNDGEIIVEYITETYDDNKLISQSSLFGLSGKLAPMFGRFGTYDQASEANEKRLKMLEK